MRRTWLAGVCVSGVLVICSSVWIPSASWSQNPQPPQRQMTPREARDAREREGKEKDEPPPLPTDPRLLLLHKDFVEKAVKLAQEYDGQKQHDKARTVCEEILKLVPKYPKAVEMLEKIDQLEATAKFVVQDVAANKDWQDTGISVIEGKPLTIQATGSWTFKMEGKLTANGMEIPREMRDFKFGSLIGVIYTGDLKDSKPFFIGEMKQFNAEQSGRLYLKMHDSDFEDNQGRLQVKITGTFEKSTGK